MDSLINFGDSLKELICNTNITIKELAKVLGISQTTIYSWLNNETEPNLSLLIMMADYFKCSIEFLIGRSDTPNFIKTKSYPPLSQRIKQVLKENSITSYRLRKMTKYDGSYFYNWEHGSQPLLSTLIELSKIADCTIDYLIGRT